MINSPSKHISRKRLEQIKQDNCIAESGKEFSDFEVDVMILEKKDREAQAAIARANRIMQNLAVNSQVNDAIAKAKARKLAQPKPRQSVNIGTAINQDTKLAFILRHELFNDQDLQPTERFSARFENKFINKFLRVVGA